MRQVSTEWWVTPLAGLTHPTRLGGRRRGPRGIWITPGRQLLEPGMPTLDLRKAIERQAGRGGVGQKAGDREVGERQAISDQVLPPLEVAVEDGRELLEESGRLGDGGGVWIAHAGQLLDHGLEEDGAAVAGEVRRV